MAGKITWLAWVKLIEENETWAQVQPRTLERDHVLAILADVRTNRAYYDAQPGRAKPREETEPMEDTERESDADKLRYVLNDMVRGINEKSIGPDESRQLDAEAAARADARMQLQLDSQARTQALHLRSVEASEREAAAWERIATALERFPDPVPTKET